MELYAVKSFVLGQERLPAFVEDRFISIGFPGIGDPSGLGIEELRGRLELAQQAAVRGGLAHESGLETLGFDLNKSAEAIWHFVSGMKDGDYVLVSDGMQAYLGDVGDYFYEEMSDNDEDGLCHRRGVTWLHAIPLDRLNPAVRALLCQPVPVARFGLPLPLAGLERWIESPQTADAAAAGAQSDSGRTPQEPGVPVDEETVMEALNVLKEALKSGDPERRERAAAAILRYARP